MHLVSYRDYYIKVECHMHHNGFLPGLPTRSEGEPQGGRAEDGAGPGYARPMPQLVLLRHGQSQWNAENLFTGWLDVDLTATGEAEAREAGRLLAAAADLDLRILHTSLLTRAIRTAELTLEEAGR